MKSYVATVFLLVILGGVLYLLTKKPTEGFESKKQEQKLFTNPAVISPEQVKTMQNNAVQDPATNLLKTMPDNVNKFEGNEDNNSQAADLNAAFSSPLPVGAQPDQVDLNKNNLKNYNSKDFLPKEVQGEWFDTDFSLAKFDINDDALINTERFTIGINTVGQSLKNASHDVRGTIPNPKYTVSPWNNSTYEPDFNLKPLC